MVNGCDIFPQWFRQLLPNPIGPEPNLICRQHKYRFATGGDRVQGARGLSLLSLLAQDRPESQSGD